MKTGADFLTDGVVIRVPSFQRSEQSIFLTELMQAFASHKNIASLFVTETMLVTATVERSSRKAGGAE
jgi:hypothetical protein